MILLHSELIGNSIDAYLAKHTTTSQKEKDFLINKRGMTGNLKKGMTVSAHFMIARRSLFDLLYQKMDDWINPSQYIENSNVASL